MIRTGHPAHMAPEREQSSSQPASTQHVSESLGGISSHVQTCAVDLYVRNHDHRRPYDFELRIVTGNGTTPLDRIYRLSPGDSRYVSEVELPTQQPCLIIVDGDVSESTTVIPSELDRTLVEIDVGNGLASISPRH